MIMLLCRQLPVRQMLSIILIWACDSMWKAASTFAAAQPHFHYKPYFYWIFSELILMQTSLMCLGLWICKCSGETAISVFSHQQMYGTIHPPAPSVDIFKSLVKTHLFSLAFKCNWDQYDTISALTSCFSFCVSAVML